MLAVLCDNYRLRSFSYLNWKMNAKSKIGMYVIQSVDNGMKSKLNE